MLKLYKLSAFLLLLIIFTGCSNDKSIVSINVGDGDEYSNNEECSACSLELIEPQPKNDNVTEESDDFVDLEVPASLLLEVDFATQAPFANWDDLHQEACEEASIIMAYYYYSGQTLTEGAMEKEIQKLVAWEEERGYQVDLSVSETIEILSDYFDLSAKIEKEVTADRIKYELSLGNLIIVPAAGRDLNNPYFQNPGPIYHMLVVKGYDRNEFITNDVGTKRGDGFRYRYNQLISAVHDWDHDLSEDGMTEDEIRSGQKAVIVVEGLLY